MKKYLITGATENYYSIILPYLTSIQLYSNFDKNVLITLDFKKESIDKIDYAYLSNDIIINKNKNNCLQHGEFLKAEFFNNLQNDDIICFTDGDILLQRSLNTEEINLIDSIKDKEIYIQYNAGPNDSLKDEFYRLSPNVSHQTIENILQTNLNNISCFNTGVIICNKKTWHELEQKYSEYYNILKNYFGHYAKQQWILSYIINRNFQSKLLIYSFHCHFHHGRVPNTHFINNSCFYNQEKVLLSHLCMDNDLPIDKNGFIIQQRRFLGEI